MRLRFALFLAALLPLFPSPGAAEKIEGYAEWLRGDVIIVDGQRVRPAPNAKFKKVDGLDEIELGYEVKADGDRGPDGVLVAKSIEAKPNGMAFFEAEVLQATDEVESVWVRKGRMFDQLPDGRTVDIGDIVESGSRVDRVQTIMSRLVPPYVSNNDLRVRVVETDEWNASAMGNGAIWVYSGLIDSMSDDELAIVLGHELAHYTHEHSRRNAKRGFGPSFSGSAPSWVPKPSTTPRRAPARSWARSLVSLHSVLPTAGTSRTKPTA